MGRTGQRTWNDFDLRLFALCLAASLGGSQVGGRLVDAGPAGRLAAVLLGLIGPVGLVSLLVLGRQAMLAGSELRYRPWRGGGRGAWTVDLATVASVDAVTVLGKPVIEFQGMTGQVWRLPIASFRRQQSLAGSLLGAVPDSSLTAGGRAVLIELAGGAHWREVAAGHPDLAQPSFGLPARRRPGARVVVVAAAVLLLVAFSVVVALTTTERAATAGDLRALVDRYVEAANRGDTTAMAALRCAAARPTTTAQASFDDQAHRELAITGPLSVLAVSPRRLGDSPAPPDAKQKVAASFGIQLAAGGVPQDEQVATAVREGGQLKLCVVGTAFSSQLEPSALGADLGSTETSLRSLLPQQPPSADYLPLEVSAPSPKSNTEQERVEGVFRHRVYGGVTISAVRYGSAGDAQAGVDGSFRRDLVDTVDQFAVPGLDGALGWRTVGFGWLFVQPASQGPYVDSVALRFADLVVTVNVANLPPGSDHGLVEHYADQVMALAHPPAPPR